MTRAIGRRRRGEPLRLATLAILFTATMVAAVLVPRQIRAALDSSAWATPSGAMTRVGAESPWVWPATSASPSDTSVAAAPHTGRRHRAHNDCGKACSAGAAPLQQAVPAK